MIEIDAVCRRLDKLAQELAESPSEEHQKISIILDLLTTAIQVDELASFPEVLMRLHTAAYKTQNVEALMVRPVGTRNLN